MSDFDDNELDRAFRANFEGRGMPVPPAVWATVRAKSLERQLIQAKTVTTWLKGLSALLGTGLAVTLYLLGSQHDGPVTTAPVQRITQVKTDTVYVTRTPGANYAVAPSSPLNSLQETQETAPSPPSLDALAATAPAPTVRPADDKKGMYTPAPASARIADRNPLSPTPTLTNPDLALSQPVDRPINEGGKPDNVSRLATELPQRSPTELSKQVSVAKRQVSVSDNSSTSQPSLSNPESGLQTIAYPILEPTTRNESFTVKPLIALSIQHRSHFRLPSVSNKKVYRPTLSKPTIARVSAAKELTISGYYSPESLLFMERHDNHSGNVHDESEHQSGQTAGVRVGLRIASKWHILTGLEYNMAVLDRHRDTEYLTAEPVNGAPTFTYPTPFGGAILPASQLAFTPKPGDDLTIQNQWDIRGNRWRMPLAVRYDFWTKTVQLVTSLPLRISVYGVAGGAFSLSQRQGMRLSVTGPDLLTTLLRVPAANGWQPSIDVQAGVGVAAGMGQHIGLFAEPTYGRALTHFGTTQSTVQNVGYLGLRLGVSYRVSH